MFGFLVRVGFGLPVGVGPDGNSSGFPWPHTYPSVVRFEGHVQFGSEQIRNKHMAEFVWG